MAAVTDKIRAVIEDVKAYVSMRLSGRITKHLFDPLTLIGGVAVLILVLLLLVLSFSGSEPQEQQRRRGAEAPITGPATVDLATTSRNGVARFRPGLA